MHASEGLSGPVSEHFERRFDAQEAESGVVGEDDLPLFVEEDQDIGNRTQDLLEQRDARKQPVQVSDSCFGCPLRGCELGLHHFDVPRISPLRESKRRIGRSQPSRSQPEIKREHNLGAEPPFERASSEPLALVVAADRARCVGPERGIESAISTAGPSSGVICAQRGRGASARARSQP
jgi:hypothetical protein